MRPNLTEDFLTAIAAGEVPLGVIVEIDYPSTPLRVWSGPTTLVWDSKNWLGVGDLGGISAVQEVAKLQASPMALELSGVPSSNVALALANTSQRRRATVWLASFTISELGVWSVIDDPYRVRRGWTNTHDGLIGVKTASIKCNVEGPLTRLRKSPPMRYTHEDQQRQFPADTGNRYAGTIGDNPIYWGTAAPSATAAASGSGSSGYNSRDYS